MDIVRSGGVLRPFTGERRVRRLEWRAGPNPGASVIRRHQIR